MYLMKKDTEAITPVSLSYIQALKKGETYG